MKVRLFITSCLGCLILITMPLALCAQGRKFPAPPQDEGLAYTRSAMPAAMKGINGTVALFAGSRYAYVYGHKVRLDTRDLLRAEAVMQGGKVFVPLPFACLLAKNSIDPGPLPQGLDILRDRWVYEVPRDSVVLPASVQRLMLKGAPYFDVVSYARSLGRHVLQTKRGLVLISKNAIAYQEGDKKLDDAIVCIFDTPEKFMEPDMAMQYIPLLKAQGKWTEHARFPKEKLEELEQGPELEWPVTPPGAYDYSGFNFSLLGSAVPSPGVYPRLLFSPQDIPMLQTHIRSNVIARKTLTEMEVLFRKTWWDAATSDGKVFDDLVNNRIPDGAVVSNTAGVYALAGWTSDHKPGIYNTHINYISNCLTTMALYCLLTDNEDLGRKTAAAICNYYQLVEKKVEEHLLTSDSEFGTSDEMANNSTTQWRGMHGVVPHMDIAFSLDFAGRYMTPGQLAFMQRLIAKATYGRRTNGGDGPLRAWRDINHVTWHLTHLLALATIEGLEGFDAEAYASGAELTRDFLEHGIDKNGQIFETNGKSGGGMQFQILSMITLARRGSNLFGHPHLRKLLQAQVLTTSPNNKETNSGGTWGGGPLSVQSLMELKSFFPQAREADYLIQEQYREPDFGGLGTGYIDPATFDLEAYRNKIEKDSRRLRLPGPTYPSFVMPLPYVTDWKPTTRQQLNLPLDWETGVHGMFSTASDQTDTAAWLSMNIRANHYIGSGHHHNDIGMFYFSGLGVNWITESPFRKTYGGIYHNEVLIDGKSQSLTDAPTAKGLYLGARMANDGAFATADQTYAYTWQWCSQVSEWGKGFSRIDSSVARTGWELETDPAVFNIFKGTTKYKMRVWWATSNFANFVPTLRALYNPVEYVYRTAGIVRGRHPYGVVVDDARKDDSEHLYQWTAMLAKGVWKSEYRDLPPGALVLTCQEAMAGSWAKPKAQPPLHPRAGDPMLLVYSLTSSPDSLMDTEVATNGPDEGKGPQAYYRLVVNRKVSDARFRILLIPFRYGESLPTILYQENQAVIAWNDGHRDEIRFGNAGNRTTVAVVRSGRVVASSR